MDKPILNHAKNLQTLLLDLEFPQSQPGVYIDSELFARCYRNFSLLNDHQIRMFICWWLPRSITPIAIPKNVGRIDFVSVGYAVKRLILILTSRLLEQGG